MQIKDGKIIHVMNAAIMRLIKEKIYCIVFLFFSIIKLIACYVSNLIIILFIKHFLHIRYTVRALNK
jgi:hypothetical protein